MVVISHLGVSCRSRDEADRFFTGLLGLPRTRSFSLSAALGQMIFQTSGEVEVLVFDDGHTKIEVFVTPTVLEQGYTHIGLEVDDLQRFVMRCTETGLECITVPRGDKQLHFVRDSSGNLFEITEKKRS